MTESLSAPINTFHLRKNFSCYKDWGTKPNHIQYNWSKWESHFHITKQIRLLMWCPRCDMEMPSSFHTTSLSRCKCAWYLVSGFLTISFVAGCFCLDQTKSLHHAAGKKFWTSQQQLVSCHSLVSSNFKTAEWSNCFSFMLYGTQYGQLTFTTEQLSSEETVPWFWLSFSTHGSKQQTHHNFLPLSKSEIDMLCLLAVSLVKNADSP